MSYRPRLIPVLLLKNGGLVKTVKFGHPTYVGDPMNAVKIFNDLGADELVFLDIDAHKEGRTIDVELVRRIGEESRMPFAVGGGIRTLADARRLIAAGAEKVVLNSEAIKNPALITEIANSFGAQSVIVCIDVKRDFWGREHVYVDGGRTKVKEPLGQILERVVKNGAGEIIIQSIEKDGTMTGYDIALIRQVALHATLPVIALGGAGAYDDIRRAVYEGYASAGAAGSIFVFYGPRRAVLINYPSRDEKKELFQKRTT